MEEKKCGRGPLGVSLDFLLLEFERGRSARMATTRSLRFASSIVSGGAGGGR